ncbi:MAG: hypothetical protein CME21_15790 [Gemmatimonadetes bacterium]|nr:hypothetical protein [Gemmatimonadota bacterium]
MMKMPIFLTLLALGFEATVQADGDDACHVEVTGVDVVTQSTTIARVKFAVETQAKTSKKASESNTRKADRVISALKNAGIDVTDLQTQGYSSHPATRIVEKMSVT